MPSGILQKGGINFAINGPAVVQGGNKATGVTINALLGQITLNNADLAAAAEVSFIVTNNEIDLRDVVVLSMVEVGTPGAYLFAISRVAVGSFTITVANLTGGTLGEALVLNFGIIKGVVRQLVLRDRRGQFNFTVNGGAVTQITSKATTVVINRIVGQITCDNASLNAATEVSFTVTNSQCSVRDIVVLSMVSVGTIGAYQFSISRIAEGSFVITIANLTGGALGEALVLNYAIIKGAPRGTVHH